jgi:hypothetical protein
MMSEAKQGSAATARSSVPFREMTLRQKFVFVCKVAVCILSFGFVFPHILID